MYDRVSVRFTKIHEKSKKKKNESNETKKYTHNFSFVYEAFGVNVMTELDDTNTKAFRFVHFCDCSRKIGSVFILVFLNVCATPIEYGWRTFVCRTRRMKRRKKKKNRIFN